LIIPGWDTKVAEGGDNQTYVKKSAGELHLSPLALEQQEDAK